MFKDQKTIKTPYWESHALCPSEKFLRYFKEVGYIKKEVARIELHKIPPYLRFLKKVFAVESGILIFSGRKITKEEAEKIDKKMKVLYWASRLFLSNPSEGLVSGCAKENADSQNG